MHEIKQLWVGDPEKNQTGYKRMFITNHGYFNIEDLTGKIVVSDAAGLEVLNPSYELENSGVQISCNRFESKDINKQEAAPKIIAIGIIVLINPAEVGCIQLLSKYLFFTNNSYSILFLSYFFLS